MANIFGELTKKYPKWYKNPSQERDIKIILINELIQHYNFTREKSTSLIKDIIEKIKQGIKNGSE